MGATRQRWLAIVITLTIMLATSSCGRPAAPVPLPPSPTSPLTSTPAPTPTPPPESEEYLAILSHSSYVDRLGYLHIVGELQNIGSKNTELNKVMATFFDSEGVPVVTASNYSYLGILIPGQKSPFEITFSSPPPVKNYKLERAWEVTERSTYAAFDITDISTEVDDEGQYWLHGRVKNIGGTPVNVVVLVSSFYDELGEVIATGFTFGDVMPLPPGETSMFTMVVDANVTPTIYTYSLQAEGY